MQVIDSHTEGEPTRLIIEGGPDLGSGPLDERRNRFSKDHDALRLAVIGEPRGFEAMVGALVCEPYDASNNAGLIFFNNAGFLGMCGHGTIGAAISLHRLGKISLGRNKFETPVGVVTVDLLDANTARIENVPSYRTASGLEVNVDGKIYRGDVAWGGNWFFLTHDAPCEILPANIRTLTDAARAVRQAVNATVEGASVDHVEFFASSDTADSRNFVLCPGGEFDRSPCGTGTSAKIACLAADGKLAAGENWLQESVTGGRFTASYRYDGEKIIPSITGRAFVTGKTRLVFEEGDPLRGGLVR